MCSPRANFRLMLVAWKKKDSYLGYIEKQEHLPGFNSNQIRASKSYQLIGDQLHYILMVLLSKDLYFEEEMK